MVVKLKFGNRVQRKHVTAPLAPSSVLRVHSARQCSNVYIDFSSTSSYHYKQFSIDQNFRLSEGSIRDPRDTKWCRKTTLEHSQEVARLSRDINLYGLLGVKFSRVADPEARELMLAVFFLSRWVS